MEVVDIVSRIVHVSTAIVLVGGMIFNRFVLSPAAASLTDDSRQALLSSVVGIWKRFVHTGILLFLLTGFYNYFRAMPLHKGDGLYHGLVGTKMLIAFVIFFIASALVGRSAAFERMRAKRLFWTTILILLAMIIVIISGYLKIRGVPIVAAPI